MMTTSWYTAGVHLRPRTQQQNKNTKPTSSLLAALWAFLASCLMDIRVPAGGGSVNLLAAELGQIWTGKLCAAILPNSQVSWAALRVLFRSADVLWFTAICYCTVQSFIYFNFFLILINTLRKIVNLGVPSVSLWG